MKVLSKSVDAFKKTPETIAEAVSSLKILIDDTSILQSSKGRYYSELAMIEMHHLKNLESSAALSLNALEKDSLTEVDVSDLVERLKKLSRRKNGILQETKDAIKNKLDDIEEKGLILPPVNTKIISASIAQR